jgi:hypothetical protein
VVGFVPSERSTDNFPRYDDSKSSFLEWWAKADYFVDDRTENVRAAAALGIAALLEPQPWNDGATSPLSLLTASSLSGESSG